jgi:hypothetical protein
MVIGNGSLSVGGAFRDATLSAVLTEWKSRANLSLAFCREE